jgi:hypothetical protein
MKLYKRLNSVNKGLKPLVFIAAEPYAAMAQCREMGFNGCIPKPIQEEILPDQLGAVMIGEEICLVQ